MRIGYSYWGFLGDRKYDDNGKILSTPDGNAFYSWSIINKLQSDGHTVFVQRLPVSQDLEHAGEGNPLYDSAGNAGKPEEQ